MIHILIHEWKLSRSSSRIKLILIILKGNLIEIFITTSWINSWTISKSKISYFSNISYNTLCTLIHDFKHIFKHEKHKENKASMYFFHRSSKYLNYNSIRRELHTKSLRLHLSYYNCIAIFWFKFLGFINLWYNEKGWSSFCIFF